MRRQVMVVGMVVGILAGCKGDEPVDSGPAPKTAPAPERESLTVGLFPALPATELEKRFGPVLVLLREQLGVDLKLSSARSFEQFHQRLQEQVYDVALIQPIDYVRLEVGTYVPLARLGGPLRGVIVSRTDSSIDSIRALKGRSISLPPKHAAVSYLLRDELSTAGLALGKDVTLRYQRNHSSCIQSVLANKTDACVTADAPLRRLSRKLDVELHAGVKTRAIPHVLWVVHSRVRSERQKAIREALLAYGSTEAGRRALKAADLPAFVEASNDEYEPVRELFSRAPPEAAQAP